MRKLFAVSCILLAASLAISGCSSKKSASRDPFAGTGSAYYKGKGPVPMGGGRYHIGAEKSTPGSTSSRTD